MELLDAIYRRRSVRSYTSEPVSEQDLRCVLEAAMQAPSAVNFQPWYFVAVQSQEKLVQLCDVMQRVAEKNAPNLRARFASHPEVAEDSLRFIGCLGGAPVCILAFWDKTEYTKSESSIIQSIAAAIENLQLAATAKDLATCWMTAPIEAGMDEELREAFAPEHGKLVAMITLGHPANVPQAPRRKQGRYTIV